MVLDYLKEPRFELSIKLFSIYIKRAITFSSAARMRSGIK